VKQWPSFKINNTQITQQCIITQTRLLAACVKVISAVLFTFLAVCLNISTVINIIILTNSNQQTQSYKFTNHIAAFLSVVLITEMLEICIQTSSDQNVQLILKSYLPVMYGTPLRDLSNLKMSLRLIKFTFVLTVRCSLFSSCLLGNLSLLSLMVFVRDSYSS
jgi:hypothetical protein